jgi:hypothetical protein
MPGKALMARKKTTKVSKPDESLPALVGYDAILAGVIGVLEAARRTAARSVNAVMTAAYWEVGRWIVEGARGARPRRSTGRSC